MPIKVKQTKKKIPYLNAKASANRLEWFCLCLDVCEWHIKMFLSQDKNDISGSTLS